MPDTNLPTRSTKSKAETLRRQLIWCANFHPASDASIGALAISITDHKMQVPSELVRMMGELIDDLMAERHKFESMGDDE